MKLKDLLIILAILSFGITLYSLFHFLKFLFNIGFSLDNLTNNISYIFSNLIQVGISIIGIIGIIQYFARNAIYNKMLKAYLLHQSFTFFLYIPITIFFQFFSEFRQTNWISIIFSLFGLFLTIVIILFYSKQKIKVLPAPVKEQSIRLVHYLIDTVYVTILIFSHYGFFLFRGSFGGETMTIISYSMFFFGPMIYYILCEAGLNQTLGKIITGTYVRSASGGAPGIGRVIGRTLCRSIPFEPFSFLPSPMAKWHDSISGTDVFRKSNVDLSEADPILDHLITDESYQEAQ